MGRQFKQTLKKLYPYLGTEGWFISGSFANFDIEDYHDIDIYFHTEKDFKRAAATTIQLGKTLIETGCSYTTYDILPAEIVQYIYVRFGTPEEIFDQMDINVCRQGILPDGTHIRNPESKDPLKIIKPSVQSFNRFRKYCDRYQFDKMYRNDLIKQCISDFIADDTYVYDYYTYAVSKYPLNYELYRTFKTDNYIVSKHLVEQAMLHAPELLL